jgi:asparagine synthase (glutamine-hydrolysing)
MHIHHGSNWGMGHTRLAIVDPANRKADMPFQLKFDNRIIHLAANGEIYNHDTLYNDMENWNHDRISGSDCEVIGHVYAKYGGPKAVTMLDGMFAFVIFEEDEHGNIVNAFAARDPVGIKPIYLGKSKHGSFVFASELKSLVGHAEPSTVVAIPAGHYWTPETGLVCYYNPDWLRKDDYAPWENPTFKVTDDEIRSAFTKAIQKRMMSDVDYGFFLSGGIDSCVVAHDLLPLYRKSREAVGDYRPINTYTVGMANSPDVMAAKAMVGTHLTVSLVGNESICRPGIHLSHSISFCTEALGGPKYVNHHVREFTPDEVFDLIPKIVYHMETYEAELIRSAIPNWLLAERASKDVKMVLTGEGADELFAGYLYFQDAKNATLVQNELRRIYGMLGHINLHRTDRMTMAHGLEARVPFLDTKFTRLIMSVDPARKMVDPEAVKTNSRGREKTLLRELFEGPNENGHSIPRPVLWRAKAMQCEGVGEDWVAILQKKVASLVTDDEMKQAHITYPINTPQTKEELYYRRIFDEHFRGMEHVITLWEGGGRAMGAAWKSDMYTREGLKDVNLLSHSLQNKEKTADCSTVPRPPSPAEMAAKEAFSAAKACGYSDFEAMLTCGGDARSLINEETCANKYHIQPKPIDPASVFRGSCTGNPPTLRGYSAAQTLYDNVLDGLKGEEIESALRNVFADQRARITRILDLPEGAEVVLCPSGSDAEYIPLAIARTLRPDAKIVNGVTQLREIGAGSAPASVGKYFSTHTPLTGRISDEMEYLAGFEGIDGVSISAREKDGKVVKASEAMDDFVKSALAHGMYPIAHGVFGGKTGLRDHNMPPSLDAGDTSLGVVDACQGRFSLKELAEWLDQDSLVLFTGSKFFQAPPFCGAVIIPPTIAEKLRQASTPRQPLEMLSSDGLGGFLTDNQLPDCLKQWAPALSQKYTNNVGLALRWEAGLAGMEALSSISGKQKTDAVNEWASSVSDMLQSEPLLDSWCVERSIVSIRVAKDSGWLDMSELRDLFRWMSMDLSHVISDTSAEEKVVLSKPVYIGQPVDVCEKYAIVRIALGVESLISYMNDKHGTLEEDRWVVKKLGAIAKHFEALKKSEAYSPLVSVLA